MNQQDVVKAGTRALVREAAALGGRVVEDSGLGTTDRRALRLLDALAADPASGAAPDGATGPTSPRVLTPRLLADELGLSPAATTALVDRLVAAGFVQRVRDLPDRRQVRLALTDHARRVGRELLGPLARRIDAAADRLEPDQAAAVAAFLDDVLDLRAGGDGGSQA